MRRGARTRSPPRRRTSPTGPCARASEELPRSRTARRPSDPDRGGDMADKGSARRAAGQDLGASSPDRIRNVVLVGPGGSGQDHPGRDAARLAPGAIPRAGSVARRHHRLRLRGGRAARTAARSRSPSPRWCTTASRSTCSTPPGYADFVGELRAGLRAADCALFVVAANEGVDEATRDAVARVRRRWHAARGGGHQARPRPRRLRRRAARRPRRRSATRCCRSTSATATGARGRRADRAARAGRRRARASSAAR